VAATERDIDILVVGEINPDIVVRDADPAPVFGQVERAVRSISITVGSSSAIFACGAARLGLRVAFHGVVGADPFGRLMLEELAAREVDVAACVVDPDLPTGATVILTDGTDRAILTAIGAIAALDVGAVPGELVNRSRHLHSGGYYLNGPATRAGLAGLFETARASGVTTSFDTNWDPDDEWDGGVLGVLRNADVFLPNAAEVCKIARNDDPEAAARSLAAIAGEGRADGGPIIVVKQGATGAFALTVAGEIVRVPALTVETRDATGAGDAFGAGFLRAWLDGGSLLESLELGVVCGGLSTRAVGGVDGQPTHAEALQALGSWNRASRPG
jgi:sugar/nucleoside kinase (ribokinase family)